MGTNSHDDDSAIDWQFTTDDARIKSASYIQQITIEAALVAFSATLS